MKRRNISGIVCLAAFFLLVAPLSAQERVRSGNGGALEIEADNGLELVQSKSEIIARGNAIAKKGDTILRADVLIAYYRDKAGESRNDDDALGGGTEVWRVEAHGNVRITSPSGVITGRHGEYNIDKAVAVLVGDNLSMVAPDQTVTAKDSLEYWEARQQVVARGEAVAIRGEHRLAADILVADLGPDENNKTSIVRMRAFDHVVLTSPTEIVQGDTGDYVVKTNIVTVKGSVKITRGDHQLNGGYAVVNLNTGVSRLLPKAPDDQTGERVRGLFMPDSKNEGGR